MMKNLSRGACLALALVGAGPAIGAEPDKHDQKQSHASDADGYRTHYLCPIRRDTRVGQIGVPAG